MRSERARASNALPILRYASASGADRCPAENLRHEIPSIRVTNDKCRSELPTRGKERTKSFDLHQLIQRFVTFLFRPVASNSWATAASEFPRSIFARCSEKLLRADSRWRARSNIYKPRVTFTGGNLCKWSRLRVPRPCFACREIGEFDLARSS